MEDRLIDNEILPIFNLLTGLNPCFNGRQTDRNSEV